MQIRSFCAAQHRNLKGSPNGRTATLTGCLVADPLAGPLDVDTERYRHVVGALANMAVVGTGGGDVGLALAVVRCPRS